MHIARRNTLLVSLGSAIAMLGVPGAVLAQSTNKPTIDADGTVHLPPVPIPYSEIASPESKAAFLRDMQNKQAEPEAKLTIAEMREQQDKRENIPARDRLLQAFAVTVTPQTIGGVQTDVIVPKSGVAHGNENRVLINLHGGAFMFGARYGGQIESIPVSSIGGFKVVTVDYREGPENHFPAASEDVAAVYRELLKTYRPENIGIYGCSAGGMLTGMALAWFQDHDLPRPGAAGMFGAGSKIRGSGDSSFVSAPLAGWTMPALPRSIPIERIIPYFAGAKAEDPMVSPGLYPERMKRFPPTLAISGTRDLALSTTLALHSQLVSLGVDADLHVWEAQPHCAFASANVDPSVPETKQAWDVIAKFFDRHLGRKKK
jgi:acetyl esterase/lipase